MSGLLAVGSYVLTAALSFVGGVLLDRWRRTGEERSACRALYTEAHAISDELAERTHQSAGGYATPDTRYWDQVSQLVAGRLHPEDLRVIRRAYVSRLKAIDSASHAVAPDRREYVSSMWLAQHEFTISAAILHAYGWPGAARFVRRLWDREARRPVCQRPSIAKALADDPRMLGGTLLHYGVDEAGRLVLVDDK